MVYHRVAPGRFVRLTPLEDASLYQFGTMTAKHYFCPVYGTHTFARPKAAPELYSVNVNCLDMDDKRRAAIKLIAFNGRDGWHQEALNRQLGLSSSATPAARLMPRRRYNRA